MNRGNGVTYPVIRVQVQGKDEREDMPGAPSSHALPPGSSSTNLLLKQWCILHDTVQSTELSFKMFLFPLKTKVSFS